MKKKSEEIRKRGAGRPSALTPPLQAKLIKLLKLGMYIEQSFLAVGLSRNCYYDWKRRGESGEEQFIELFRQFDQASAEAEASALSIVRKGDFRANSNMRFMERRFRDRWAGDNQKQSVSVTSTATDAGGGSQTTQFVVEFVEPGDPRVEVTGEEE